MIKSGVYTKLLKLAIGEFWRLRNSQNKRGSGKDVGNRSAVTGGKHLSGFEKMLAKIAIEIGVPESWVYTKDTVLPGYFRATMNWDILIINDKNQLLAVLELKSQVGSIGNNLNNRAEEAIGSAVDLWTTYRENGFPQTFQPWLGFLIIVERSEKSDRTVGVKEPHYPVREEFYNASYLDRYALLCKKLLLEKHYNGACVLWTTDDLAYGDQNENISLKLFLNSYLGYLIGKLEDR